MDVWISRPGRVAIGLLVMATIVTGVVLVVVRARSTPAPDYVGRQWDLVNIVRNGQRLPLPSGKKAGISFYSGNRFGLDDSLNYAGGKFEPRDSGYVTREVSVTLQMYVGTDPDAPALFAALAPLAKVGAQRAEVRQGQLVLRAGGDVFTFDDAGVAAPVG